MTKPEIVKHIVEAYDVTITGPVAEVERYRYDFALAKNLLDRAEELLSEYLEGWEGANWPSELRTKDMVCSILDYLRKVKYEV